MGESNLARTETPQLAVPEKTIDDVFAELPAQMSNTLGAILAVVTPYEEALRDQRIIDPEELEEQNSNYIQQFAVLASFVKSVERLVQGEKNTLKLLDKVAGLVGDLVDRKGGKIEIINNYFSTISTDNRFSEIASSEPKELANLIGRLLARLEFDIASKADYLEKEFESREKLRADMRKLVYKLTALDKEFRSWDAHRDAGLDSAAMDALQHLSQASEKGVSNQPIDNPINVARAINYDKSFSIERAVKEIIEAMRYRPYVDYDNGETDDGKDLFGQLMKAQSEISAVVENLDDQNLAIKFVQSYVNQAFYSFDYFADYMNSPVGQMEGLIDELESRGSGIVVLGMLEAVVEVVLKVNLKYIKKDGISDEDQAFNIRMADRANKLIQKYSSQYDKYYRELGYKSSLTITVNILKKIVDEFRSKDEYWTVLSKRINRNISDFERRLENVEEVEKHPFYNIFQAVREGADVDQIVKLMRESFESIFFLEEEDTIELTKRFRNIKLASFLQGVIACARGKRLEGLRLESADFERLFMAVQDLAKALPSISDKDETDMNALELIESEQIKILYNNYLNKENSADYSGNQVA